MAPVYTPLTHSKPAFASAGVPFSERYRDVYHAVQGPIAQADYVFLQGNGLPERWRGRARFTVCETGFGLGFNFLALWQAWRADPDRPARLHVVSVEAHPFSREHMTALLAGKLEGDLRDLAETLIAQWPPLLPGLHRIDLEGGALTLTLAFGYALDVVPQLTAHVDAFFLDGFSPARNPEMWSPPLMKALARLAAPGATAATWSSAGDVRRALAEAGFDVRKHPGFGYKRVMTVATYAPRYVPRHASTPPPVFTERHAVVVGAGIAGANVAHALALRGWRVTVVAPEAEARGGATVDEVPNVGHLAAALTPLVARDDNARARLTRAGALRALARWAPWMDGDIVARTGTLQLAKSAGKEADLQATVDALGFPADWVRAVDADEASAIAGTPVPRGGLYFPDGLRVRPQALCERLLAHPGITRVTGRVDRLRRMDIRSSHDALAAGASPWDALSSDAASSAPASCWQALDSHGAILATAEVVIVANSTGAPALLRHSSPAHVDTPGSPPPARFYDQLAVAGQITTLPAEKGGWGPPPRCIVAGEGYVLPPVADQCVTGSTYVYDVTTARATLEGTDANLVRATHLLPSIGPVTRDLDGLGGWAGWRAVLPGRLPVVGEWPAAPGVWLATGYASRGLTWSALAGDVIAAALDGEPLMLERDLLHLIGWR
ncbi:tRNA 5-methylaminomethyl-2-thiouridine biosynthesis bifunctional protein MnmC [Pigmentiphaga litoralis]|uniref:tRNA (5-methylaminomethyl-2-thiouridine)(34)-methyltransferase MnmD n=1 Tax=Pigmentiphaga litoralis TaxID=516702 RepID=UPI001678D332|nr:tRNA (5-methylaminomethyl-2-thiouridine)(34)-methyltransferase MnmD [Pigmentiphaga litoralis]GGX16811.1 tRNA 5-methylaminomethyl-2-thiouridine biosynthesis bifunctional protein MnmC [Pigmentiphaga litoralis]